MLFRFAYPVVLIIALCIIVIGALVTLTQKKGVFYRHSLATWLIQRGHSSSFNFTIIHWLLRLITLMLLALVIARPQWGDVQRETNMHGIDIMISLDISGSMGAIDDAADGRTRIDIAKAEAIRFINKRTDDAIGLVLFAKDAFSRCPITLDKRMLKDIVEHVYIGFLDERETHLSHSIIMAANRLKDSKAASKVIILLTDGAPSQGDLEPDVALDIAKGLGIKIYTVGIGSPEPVLVMTPQGPMFLPPFNKDLLEKIATSTGGKAFYAHDAHDMRAIYDTIDRLEKSSYNVKHYAHFEDTFTTILLSAMILLVVELFLSTIVWFCV